MTIRLRVLYILVAVATFYGSIYLYKTSFLEHCNSRTGFGIRCGFSTGEVAQIGAPSNIQIYDFYPFTIEYQDSSGKTLEIEAPSHFSLFKLEFDTSEPVKIKMLKSHGGVDVPAIMVIPTSSEYSTLDISRTWSHPLNQLIQWPYFPAFLLLLVASGLSFSYAFDK